MRFAINYSEPAATLLRRGELEFDLYKCLGTREHLGMIRSGSLGRPAYAHFRLWAGHRPRARVDDWDLVESFLNESETRHVNFHLAPQGEDFPGVPYETLDEAHREAVAERMVEDVAEVVRRVGPERVIVENFPYQGRRQHTTLRPAAEPEVVQRITDETGCGLLLDLSHARVAARHLGMDEREYVSALPLDRLRELHFSGQRWPEREPVVFHEAMGEEDWRLLGWALEQICAGEWAKPWVAVFEYGRDLPSYQDRNRPKVLLHQAPVALEMVEGVDENGCHRR